MHTATRKGVKEMPAAATPVEQGHPVLLQKMLSKYHYILKNFWKCAHLHNVTHSLQGRFAFEISNVCSAIPSSITALHQLKGRMPDAKT